MGAECVGLRGRGLSEDSTGVKRQCELQECCKDEFLGFKRFEVVIQDFGRGAKEDLNHPDLEEEIEGEGEVGGVRGSVEADVEEPAKDSHEDVRDMELGLEVAEVAGDRREVEEAKEQARQGRDLRR